MTAEKILRNARKSSAGTFPICSFGLELCEVEARTLCVFTQCFVVGFYVGPFFPRLLRVCYPSDEEDEAEGPVRTSAPGSLGANPYCSTTKTHSLSTTLHQQNCRIPESVTLQFPRSSSRGLYFCILFSCPIQCIV